MSTASRTRLRWWRDRARFVVVAGLGLYAIGFFLDWPFEIESSWIFRWLGAAVVAAGAGCCLLWFVDTGREDEV